MQGSEERDSLKELQRYIGKKKKTPNSESFREQTSNAQVKGQSMRCEPIEHPASTIKHRF
jgi:hypothetical protein